MGRTGKPFAVDHWNVSPDLILIGKGIASGYAPLGAVIVAADVAKRFLAAPALSSTALRTARILWRLRLGTRCLTILSGSVFFERVEPAGRELRAALEKLQQYSVVGDMRGKGLLFAVEIVRDAKTREPFPADAHMASRIQEDALEAGVMTYPMQGSVDGVRGDHILIAPPFTITSAMIQMLAAALDRALADLERTHLAGMGVHLLLSDRPSRWLQWLASIFVLSVAMIAAAEDIAPLTGFSSGAAAREMPPNYVTGRSFPRTKSLNFTAISLQSRIRPDRLETINWRNGWPNNGENRGSKM